MSRRRSVERMTLANTVRPAYSKPQVVLLPAVGGQDQSKARL